MRIKKDTNTKDRLTEVSNLRKNVRKQKNLILLLNVISYSFTVYITLLTEVKAIEFCRDITNNTYFLTMIGIAIAAALLFSGIVYHFVIYSFIRKLNNSIKRHEYEIIKIKGIDYCYE